MGFFDTVGAAASFTRLGDTVSGIIDGPYTERQATEFGSSKLKFYSDGRPWMMACVPLRTNERDPGNPRDDGLRTLYVDKISMRDAIVQAFKAVGASDIEVGGTLTVQYVGDEPSDKGNPSKVFTASYARPVGALGQAAASQPPAYAPPVQVSPPPAYAPPAPPQAQQAPTNGHAPAPAVGDQIAAIRALAAGGMTAVQISAAIPTFTADAVQAVLSLPA
jgi:hypothetical protein